MAVVEFQEGGGTVGRSVFQKLREFRKLHEVSWSDELLKSEEEKDGKRATLTRRERGQAIGNQRANTVADMAAVLSGAGRGNHIWVDSDADADADADATAEDAAQVSKELAKVTIYWANEEDQQFADWTANVSHEVLENFNAEIEPAMVSEVEATATPAVVA
jgi:hypothetical protein